MTVVLASIGAKALYLMYGWLACGIAASYLSERKGYGEKPGLATGLILSIVGTIVWLIVPPRADSKWKLQGPLPFGGSEGETVAEARARGVGDDEPPS